MSVEQDSVADPSRDDQAEARVAQILQASLKLGKNAFGGSQIFGEPIRNGEVIVVPVGSMRGGAGGGGAYGPLGVDQRDGAAAGEATGTGSGLGWGMTARAHGAIVIHGDKVRYVPALDVNRIVVAGVVGLVAAVVLAPRIIREAKH